MFKKAISKINKSSELLKRELLTKTSPINTDNKCNNNDDEQELINRNGCIYKSSCNIPDNVSEVIYFNKARSDLAFVLNIVQGPLKTTDSGTLKDRIINSIFDEKCKDCLSNYENIQKIIDNSTLDPQLSRLLNLDNQDEIQTLLEGDILANLNNKLNSDSSLKYERDRIAKKCNDLFNNTKQILCSKGSPSLNDSTNKDEFFLKEVSAEDLGAINYYCNEVKENSDSKSIDSDFIKKLDYHNHEADSKYTTKDLARNSFKDKSLKTRAYLCKNIPNLGAPLNEQIKNIDTKLRDQCPTVNNDDFPVLETPIPRDGKSVVYEKSSIRSEANLGEYCSYLRSYSAILKSSHKKAEIIKKVAKEQGLEVKDIDKVSNPFYSISNNKFAVNSIFGTKKEFKKAAKEEDIIEVKTSTPYISGNLNTNSSKKNVFSETHKKSNLDRPIKYNKKDKKIIIQGATVADNYPMESFNNAVQTEIENRKIASDNSPISSISEQSKTSTKSDEQDRVDHNFSSKYAIENEDDFKAAEVSTTPKNDSFNNFKDISRHIENNYNSNYSNNALKETFAKDYFDYNNKISKKPTSITKSWAFAHPKIAQEFQGMSEDEQKVLPQITLTGKNIEEDINFLNDEAIERIDRSGGSVKDFIELIKEKNTFILRSKNNDLKLLLSFNNDTGEYEVEPYVDGFKLSNIPSRKKRIKYKKFMKKVHLALNNQEQGNLHKYFGNIGHVTPNTSILNDLNRQIESSL